MGKIEVPQNNPAPCCEKALRDECSGGHRIGQYEIKLPTAKGADRGTGG